MFDAVILAAGYSSRANTNKLVLNIDGKTVIEKTIDAFYNQCKRIIVVTGHYHDDIYNVIKSYEKVVVVKNENYSKGMFTSIQKGVCLVEDDFFIIPGDYPLIKEGTIKGLIAALKQDHLRQNSQDTSRCGQGDCDFDIFVPSYEGRRGHPLLLRAYLKEALMEEDDQSNLKSFRDRYKLYHLLVEDQGILMDIDTYDDYNRINLLNHQETS